MKHPLAEIFSQGEEVISGQVADTNAAWLSQQLVEMGFVISRHTAVGDKLEDLIELLVEISMRADFCICTGGLGPTVDDLTAEAVANAFDCPLTLDSTALAQIEHYFLNRNRVMAESNKKQAYFPQGAIRIDNDWGTAPGFAIQKNRCWFVFVPGVPTEMKNMFIEQIKAELEQRFVLKKDKLIAIKSIGIGESDLQQKLNDFTLPDNVQLSFRATTDEVQTKLLFPAETTDSNIKNCVDQLVEKIGDVVYAVDDLSKSSTGILTVISQLMAQNNWTLSVLETASQGLIAAKCIGQSWLIESKYQQFLAGIDPRQDDLSALALSTAQQLKQNTEADLMMLQIHSADKSQFQDKQKSIVLYNVLITPNGTYQNTSTVSGSMTRKQNQAAIRALDLLRRVLQQRAINPTK